MTALLSSAYLRRHAAQANFLGTVDMRRPGQQPSSRSHVAALPRPVPSWDVDVHGRLVCRWTIQDVVHLIGSG